jgi:enamine deaminase RidA (YjgF/YER057c/UK114 family)
MALESINPEDIDAPLTYSHVVVATGTRMVFVAGQVAEDKEGSIVGHGDMTAQAHQVFTNIGQALSAAGARPGQVTKLTIFVANYKREHLAQIKQGRAALFGDHKPADTLVGVAALSRPECLLEVDAVAVVDDAV